MFSLVLSKTGKIKLLLFVHCTFSNYFSPLHMIWILLFLERCATNYLQRLSTFSLVLQVLPWFSNSLLKFIVFPSQKADFLLNPLCVSGNFPLLFIYFLGEILSLSIITGDTSLFVWVVSYPLSFQLGNIRISHSIMTWSKRALFLGLVLSDYAIFPALLRGNIIQSLKSPSV